MDAMRLLFLAPLAGAFGEALQGARLAASLVARGHQVTLAAPGNLKGLAGDRIAFERIDDALPRLDRELPRLVARARAERLVLVDVAAVGKVFGAYELDAAALGRAGAPVFALDCWNLPETGIVWDYGSHTETIARSLLDFPRLAPAPAVRPDAPGAFAALPATAPATDAERRRLAADLAMADGDHLVVWPTAIWQHAGAHVQPVLRTIAGALPPLILRHLAALGPRLQLVHVGPIPLEAPEIEALRYRHVGQLAPWAFERVVACADLLLGFNAAATSLATAVAARVPILLGLTRRRWNGAPPLRAWPLSLEKFLAPLMAGNPYYDAMRIADPLDAGAWIAAARELLDDPTALRARQEAYAARVSTLPSGAERLLTL